MKCVKQGRLVVLNWVLRSNPPSKNALVGICVCPEPPLAVYGQGALTALFMLSIAHRICVEELQTAPVTTEFSEPFCHSYATGLAIPPPWRNSLLMKMSPFSCCPEKVPSELRL